MNGAAQLYFNSRPSARGDSSGVRPARRRLPISIHAPPRGATVSPDSEGKLYIFQFTPLREGRPFQLTHIELAAPFQFTPLREGRPTRKTACTCITPISIHAPPRGATLCGTSRVRAVIHFNSRPSARGDSGGAEACSCRSHFNSRPSARGDGAGRHHLRRGDYFNSRPSARGDPVGHVLRAVDAHDFNSRPSARGDLRRTHTSVPPTNFNSRPSARGDGTFCHR